MVSVADIDRQKRIGDVIVKFLQSYADKEEVPSDKMESWIADWLRKQSAKILQIQLVTHPIKATHPDIKITESTSLFCPSHLLPKVSWAGSHCLPAGHSVDIVGNAAALPIGKFLLEKFEEKTLFDMLKEGDQDLQAVLTESYGQSLVDIQNLQKIVEPKCLPSSHTLAKQVYWLVGDRPCDDTHYHLLAPLFSSSLSTWFYEAVQEASFSEAAKAARAARSQNAEHPDGYCEYYRLAVEKKGGTKPQNVSLLNSKRNGNNYLLPSLPPLEWKSVSKPPYDKKSAFRFFERLREVKLIVDDLSSYLRSDPKKIMETRNTRDSMIDQLLEQLIQFSTKIQQFEPGWSKDSRCELPLPEQRWLDPFRSSIDAECPEDWHDKKIWIPEIARRFANWLNSKLGRKLPVGDDEFNYWYSQCEKELKEFEVAYYY